MAELDWSEKDLAKLERRKSMEVEYQEHIAQEGDGMANDHPDGCFYCGSGLHHSQDCPHKDEEHL